MKILDKISAKKLGISVERYKETLETADAIWINLYQEKKVINPFVHLREDKILSIIKVVEYFIIVYGLLNMSGKDLQIIFICLSFVLLGRFFINIYDMKQFKKKVEELAERREETQ